jgi:hypothetical protein
MFNVKKKQENKLEIILIEGLTYLGVRIYPIIRYPTKFPVPVNEFGARPDTGTGIKKAGLSGRISGAFLMKNQHYEPHQTLLITDMHLDTGTYLWCLRYRHLLEV